MNIAGYTVGEKLYHGKNFSVFRAHNSKSNSSAILKMLDKKATTHANMINELKNEYNYLRQVDSPNVIKALAWNEDKDYAAMVLEDIHAVSLKDFIIQNQNQPFAIDTFIEIALLITNGLSAVHSQNIIHKDINPNNIVWNHKSKHLQIIDFNIASKFDIKISYLGNPEKLQGTLAYISPEQTGRMNRSVDQRTDLYSLGVTFYEMLTGQLPFNQNNSMEIVYSHLARYPESPNTINPNIPEILSQIILKLLAKNPEERYQSVGGLTYDLKKAVQTHMKPFTLGENDFLGKLQIPEKLYGRQIEIEHLLNTYHSVCQGEKLMTLVTGYAGVGKTSLVNVIHQPITRDRGYFVSGKFDQLQRTTPYFAFIQALKQFCHLLLSEKQETLMEWKERILKDIGTLGKLLIDIVPSLEYIIGKQPDVPDVGGEEAKRRLIYVLGRFIDSISTKEHPLVMFIDDLQWADLASLNLIQSFMTEKNSYFYFIGAYRDNEVSPTHPLMTTLEEIRKNITIQTISLKNLTLSNLRVWVSDTLKITPSKDLTDVDSLTALIYQKTQGNAFFTIQFLKNLYENNLLYFDFKQSRWKWDIIDIEKQNITDNVVDLLVKKLKTLPVEVQDVLKLAACIGNVFDLHTLCIISGKEKIAHIESLEKALTEELVYYLDQEQFTFVHDRIYQAVYSLIPGEDRKSLHYKIGRLLLENFETPRSTKTIKEEQNLFDIVNHLNIGIELITEEEEKINLARLNLRAGRNAKLSAAYKVGSDYINTGLMLLPNDSWQRYYELTLSLHDEAIQTTYLCGDYQKMENYAETVIAHTQQSSQRATAYEYRLLSLMAQNQPHLAVDLMQNIFGMLGVPIPPRPGMEETMEIIAKTHAALIQKGIESLKKLPEMTDPNIRLVIRLFAMGAAALLFSRQDALPYTVATMANLIFQYGLTVEAPYILAFYGLLRVNFGDIAVAYRLGEITMELIKRNPHSEAISGRTIAVVCYYMMGQKKHFKEVCKQMIDSAHTSLNAGDFEYAAYFLTNYISCVNRTDTELNKIKERIDANRDAVLQLKQAILLTPLTIETSYNQTLLGKTTNPSALDIDRVAFFKDIQAEGFVKLFSWMIYVKNLNLAILFDDNEHLLEYLKAVEDYGNNLNVPLTYVVCDVLFYSPLAYLRLYTLTDDPGLKSRYMENAKNTMEIMKKWAKFGPLNFLHKYYLQKAEYYRVTGKKKKAAQYYDKAIETAFENEYIHDAALANELAAKYYMNLDQNKLASLHFIDARNCYRKWGAVTKVKDLEEKYPKFLSLNIFGTSTHPNRNITSLSTDSASDSLDFNSILKASQTLSGEVQLKNLLEKMMQILIENAGAQKSMMIENEDGQLLIQAEGSTEGVSGILQAIPIGESGKLPLSVINLVARSKQELVFDNLSKDPNFSLDPYIQKKQPKSVVCCPILRKGELTAIIYLENDLVEGAFTQARLEVLNMLSSQIAISMENTRLYERLEEKVRIRTKELQKANEKLEKNHKELAESHKKINDSVNYASRIQNAVLPSQEILSKLLPGHFIFYRPCSVISGDFYWIKQIKHKIIVAAADCTGHGVPGALVSMLGMAFLNEIGLSLESQSNLFAGTLLDELRGHMKIALKQSGRSVEHKEGMDIALCIIDPIEKKLQYAGAHNPLYLINNNHLIEVKADRMPIGISHKEIPFTSHELTYEPGSMIYLFSDGYADQNNEEGSIKFSKKKFKEMLVEIHRQPVEKQKKILIRRFDEWKGNTPQRDDVLVFGIQL